MQEEITLEHTCMNFSTLHRTVYGNKWSTEIKHVYEGSELELALRTLCSYALEEAGVEYDAPYPWKGFRLRINRFLTIDFTTNTFEIFAPLRHEAEVVSVPITNDVISTIIMLNYKDCEPEEEDLREMRALLQRVL